VNGNEMSAERFVGKSNISHASDGGASASVGSNECHLEDARLYSIPELTLLPEPEWQIDKIFPLGSLVGIYGASGSGKSFLALSLALAIATGQPWLDRVVRKGPVVYVAAEGGRAIRQRIAAWMRYHDVDAAPDAYFKIEPLQVCESDDVDRLLASIGDRQIKPMLIVIDTLARCFVGEDENSAEAMGRFVAGIGTLIRKTGATVIVVHHSGRNGEYERGSTALRAAADVMMLVAKVDNAVVVTNNKQKDGEDFPEMFCELIKVDGTDSCVIQAHGVEEAKKAGSRNEQALAALRDIAPASWDAWWKKSGLSRTTFQRTCVNLKNGGCVEKKKGAWQIVSGT
jgi:hypothetical protein